jgi:putative tryptophan/tyrosine transport system substrate-binding protein
LLAFATLARERPDALFVSANGFFERGIATFARSTNGGLIVAGGRAAVFHRDLIITLAARHKLPAVYFRRYLVTAGGLISYGATIDQPRRAAGYVGTSSQGLAGRRLGH